MFQVAVFDPLFIQRGMTVESLHFNTMTLFYYNFFVVILSTAAINYKRFIFQNVYFFSFLIIFSSHLRPTQRLFLEVRWLVRMCR